MSIEKTLRSSFKLLIYSWIFVVFFLCNKRNEIRWFVRELNMTNFRAFILKTCRLSDMRKFGFVQTAKVKHLSVLWSCPYSPKGIRFSCMSTSESCGKSCVSVLAKTSLFIRLTSHLMSMLCFLSDHTFNRQILNLWWAFVGSEDGLYPSVVLFSVSSCLNRWYSKCTFGLAFICLSSISPKIYRPWKEVTRLNAT